MNMLIQHPFIKLLGILFLSLILAACNSHDAQHSENDNHGHDGHAEAEVIKGPNGGRLLNSDNFTLELAIFETGVPPEFRAWASLDGIQLSPADVDLNIKLFRLSAHEEGKVDNINFTQQGDALRGDGVIYEPHSFVVSITAMHKGRSYKWQYDNFEGRTKIEKAVADALEIGTDIAGEKTLKETIEVFGKITPNTERVRQLGARFPGVIKSVKAVVGDKVKKGQVLATIESNESLNLYSIRAPISGVITQRNANSGEQTTEMPLFVINDPSTVWVDLAIFPKDINRVKISDQVSFDVVNGTKQVQGEISFISVMAEANQSVTARMVVDNKDGHFLPGNFVRARIKVGEHKVPLAVKRSGLQAFRDFTVVYAKVGDEYEVRMLELGRQDAEWAEVLGGLRTGTEYVSENSYIIKADVEKSGASHDH